MSDQFDVRLDGAGETKTLTILKGEATKQPDLVEVGRFQISGQIDAPLQWWNYYKASGLAEDMVNPIQPILRVSRAAMSVELDLAPHLTTMRRVIGQIAFNADLQAFGINVDKRYGLQELAQFLKRSRMFFADKEENMQLVTRLKNFKAKLTRNIEQSKDDRGNATNSLVQSFESELDLGFTLELPIFKGDEPVKFYVEILLEARDAGISLWLESAELQDAVISHRDLQINYLVDSFEGIMPIFEI